MDNPVVTRETGPMLRAGQLRGKLARTLNAAYGDGLLSESTLAYRLELLFSEPLVDPSRVTGDLTFRSPRSAVGELVAHLRATWERALRARAEQSPRLLALDWDGGQDELLVGRREDCDIVLGDLTVSRRHARLIFADGSWTLRDLGSRNGTTVNGAIVSRCQLRPGDRLQLGDEILIVD